MHKNTLNPTAKKNKSKRKGKAPTTANTKHLILFRWNSKIKTVRHKQKIKEQQQSKVKRFDCI